MFSFDELLLVLPLVVCVGLNPEVDPFGLVAPPGKGARLVRRVSVQLLRLLCHCRCVTSSAPPVFSVTSDDPSLAELAVDSSNHVSTSEFSTPDVSCPTSVRLTTPSSYVVFHERVISDPEVSALLPECVLKEDLSQTAPSVPPLHVVVLFELPSELSIRCTLPTVAVVIVPVVKLSAGAAEALEEKTLR